MEKRIKAGFLAILALAMAASFAGTLYRAVFSSYDSLFYENRSAAPMPEAAASNLWDGSYMTDLDEYLGDQYIARTRLIKAQTLLNLLLGRPVVNDIVGRRRAGCSRSTATPVPERRISPTRPSPGGRSPG